MNTGLTPPQPAPVGPPQGATYDPRYAPGAPGGAPHGGAPYGTAPYGSAPYGSAPYGSAPYGAAPQPGGPSGTLPQGGAPRQPGSSSRAPRVIAILFIVLGGLIVLGAIGSAVVATVFSGAVHASVRTLAVDGVGDLDVDLAAGSLRVEFADVSQAELQVTSPTGADRWTLRRDGDELTVQSPRFSGFPWVFGGSGDAVLRLPRSLEGLDAELGLSAGDLTADGRFGDLQLDVGAGGARLDGTADTLGVELSAGRADIDLADVRTADLSVSAGDLDASFTGAQPRTLTLDVSAGSLTVTVPDGEYDVSSDVSAGDFDNRVGSTPGADSTVSVEVSAGQATLRAR